MGYSDDGYTFDTFCFASKNWQWIGCSKSQHMESDHSQGKITWCWELQRAGGRRVLHGTLEYDRSWWLQVQQSFLFLVNILEFVQCLLSCFKSHISRTIKNKIQILLWSFEFPASLRAEIHEIYSGKICQKPMILLASSCLPSCLARISRFWVKSLENHADALLHTSLNFFRLTWGLKVAHRQHLLHCLLVMDSFQIFMVIAIAAIMELTPL